MSQIHQIKERKNQVENPIDIKIKNLLQEMDEASRYYQENFIQPVIEHRETTHDIYAMALAQEKMALLENQLQLYLSEKFPEQFSPQAVSFLNKEKERLTKRIRSWENRQFPVREE